MSSKNDLRPHLSLLLVVTIASASACTGQAPSPAATDAPVGIDVRTAADEVVQGVLKAAGGEGGVIVMDRRGNVAVSHNTTAMGRGYIGQTGEPSISFTEDR